MCAVHALNDRYPTLHAWGAERKAWVWCAKVQLLTFRKGSRVCILKCCNDDGLIITDEYGAREGEESIISNFKADMIIGTQYHKLERICMIPLMLNSRHLAYLQLADVVIGIIVSALSRAGNTAWSCLMMWESFSLQTHARAPQPSPAFFQLPSSDTAQSLLPPKFQRAQRKIFQSLDDKYIVTSKGLVERGKQEPLL